MGVERACSVSQLERIRTATTPVRQVGIRVNPGVGRVDSRQNTTGFSKTNVGGPSSSLRYLARTH
jgi:diaminopimelate decarboxylase